MREVTIRCDRAKFKTPKRQKTAHLLEINQHSPRATLRLGIANLSHKLLSDLDPLTRDLLDVAAYVYYADQSVHRGTERDVFNEDWSRDFTFQVPMRKRKAWQRKSVTSTLTALLTTLTDDSYRFEFADREARPEQLACRDIGTVLPYGSNADCVMLFSGGLDSLAGAIHLYAQGRKPILVSHQSRSVLAKLQRDLAARVREQCAGWQFPHLEITINRIGSEAEDNSQRSRSFLYLSFGALVAHELGIPELVVCENGITTWNLPRLGQTTGTLASRSTHPAVISLFRKLVSELLGFDLRIAMPFLWNTRAEIIEILKSHSAVHLIPLSSSCNHARRPIIYPHCGVCSQCVDRRFAEAFASVEVESGTSGYEKDIFIDSLAEGTERMQPVSAVQFALDLRGRDIDSFCQAYPQVYDALGALPDDSEKILASVHALHQRYAEEIVTVMSKKTGENWEQMANGQLPSDSLLSLIRGNSTALPTASLLRRAEALIKTLRECPVGDNTPYENVVEDILTYLFCENVPPFCGLNRPDAQSINDEGYERRDLLFENHATEGFWAEVRQNYDSKGVVADAKNHSVEIDGAVVHDFAAKYLSQLGIGRFGLLLGRKMPQEIRNPVPMGNRVPSAIEAQKKEWTNSPHKMIVLLDDKDLENLLRTKAVGGDPTKLISDRILAVHKRI